MNPYFNRITVMGNLGKTPELKYLPDETAITTLNIAYNERYTDKQGTPQQRTEWFSAVLYGKQAEIVCHLCRTGNTVQVHGKIRSRHYTDKHEQERTVWEIIADSVQIISASADNKTEPETESVTELPTN
ncbi:single-stranded DNA-binding protein [Stenoxybacter acetivorans]|uniref:single-stranded DNA-binding protein n=1 Tax=Stenoxybacter acetivorans TaxID=422441 RepID=UPI00068A7B3D|nr:single-stranded DNA-binding protein [Stenoxybacter acetivorans]